MPLAVTIDPDKGSPGTQVTLEAEEFDVEEWGSPENLDLNDFTEKLEHNGKDRFAFGMVSKDKTYLFRTKDSYISSEEKLDVTWLQEKVLEKELKITSEDIKSGENLSYTRDAKEAINMVQKGEAELSFILNSPGLDQTVKLAQTNERLPQKSTYFFPKLISGLVLNRLD